MSAHDLTGQTVKNDGTGIRKALRDHYRIVRLEHIGNFVFRAKTACGLTILVITQPEDLSMETLRIERIIEIK